MFSRRTLCLVLSVIFLTACGSRARRAPAIGEAFVGPATLTLRAEISLHSKPVGVVHHGEKVEIIQQHRKFLKVRASGGAEGWTDTRQLLGPEQMSELQRAADRAKDLLSQGRATTFGPLNIHSEPNRQSPSFYQIGEGEPVDVVGQRLAPRAASAPPSLVIPKKKARPTQPPSRSKRESSSRVPALPLPKPPGPPSNWLDLSRTRMPVVEEKPAEETPPPSSVAMEDWSLVRTKGSQAGWVLTRNLHMSVPDEVAQYAEGHRISSYFSIGQVEDEGVVKKCWLWTTIIKGGQSYQFDSFRVFVWSLRHHRYETAHVERNLRGYFPVEVRTVEVPSRQGTSTSTGFSVIVEDEEGGLKQKTYAFQGYHVALLSTSPWKPSSEVETPPGSPVQLAPHASEKSSWTERLKSILPKRRH
jgi:hypothetical protein